jgi:hypothetical protein
MLSSFIYDKIDIDYKGSIKDDVYLTLQIIETYKYIEKELNFKFPLVKNKELLKDIGKRIYKREELEKEEYVIICYSLCNDILVPLLKNRKRVKAIEKIEDLKKEIENLYREYKEDIEKELGFITKEVINEIIKAIGITLLYKTGKDLSDYNKEFNVKLEELNLSK